MSTTMDNTPAEDPTKQRDYTIKVTLGQEALDQFLDSSHKPMGGRAGELQTLAIAFATICMQLRDAQYRVKTMTDEGKLLDLDVPTRHHIANLRIAGRQAAVAITQMELALGMALKAAVRVG